MSSHIFCEELGNAYVIGCGSRKIAEFWYDSETGSSSPLTKEDAKKQGEELVEYLTHIVAVRELALEDYGDSDETIENIRFNNKMSKMTDKVCNCDDEDEDDDSLSFEDFMKLMFVSSIMKGD